MNKYVVVRENILGYVLPNNTLGILHASPLRGATVKDFDGTTFLPMDANQIRPATLADFEAFGVSPKGYDLTAQAPES